MVTSYSIIYDVFDKELIKEVGFSWFGARDKYTVIGNCPGIYPDTALLFVRMIKNLGIGKVLEFGSGMSTLYLAKACEMKGIAFSSYEEDADYMRKTKELLRTYNIKGYDNNYDNIVKPIVPINVAERLTQANIDILKSELTKIDFNVGMIFLDASGYLRNTILTSNIIYKIPFILMDDAECHTGFISKFFVESGRHNFCYFNRVGREDRSQFISCIDDGFNMMNFVNKNIPCLGSW